MPDYLLQLDRHLFYFINHSLGNAFFDVLMPVLRNPFTWMPLYVFIVVFCLWRYKKGGAIIILFLALTFALADFGSATVIKSMYKRVRPCNDPAMAATIVSRIPCGTGYSFPSAHASNHFAIAVFLSMVFYRRYKWVLPVGLLWAAAISFAQVYVGVHYPIDVTCGAIYGILSGLLLGWAFWKVNPILDMKFKLIGIALLLVSLANHLYANAPVDTPRYDIVKLEIKRLQRQRTIHIYFPPSYWNTRKKFPVIYIQDGQTAFIEGAYNNESLYADSLVNLMPANKQCIIVAIQSGLNSVRMKEYNPYAGSSDGAIYAAYVVKDVKTYIDTTFRTQADAKHTAVVGSSMGGLISMYIAAKYSDIVGVAGIFSPAFWYAEPVYDDMSKQAISPKSKFFFAYGDKEGPEAEYVNRMTALLQQKKFNARNVPSPLIIKGGNHDEKQWRTDFDAFYRWFSNQF